MRRHELARIGYFVPKLATRPSFCDCPAVLPVKFKKLGERRYRLRLSRIEFVVRESVILQSSIEPGTQIGSPARAVDALWPRSDSYTRGGDVGSFDADPVRSVLPLCSATPVWGPL